MVQLEESASVENDAMGTPLLPNSVDFGAANMEENGETLYYLSFPKNEGHMQRSWGGWDLIIKACNGQT